LKLEEDDDAAQLSQYSVRFVKLNRLGPLSNRYMNRCSEVDKFLLTYVILKLRLIKGKCILFVNDVDRGYRLKLFLEQFLIKSCVLNSELPLNSRYGILDRKHIIVNHLCILGTTRCKNLTRVYMIILSQLMNVANTTDQIQTTRKFPSNE
jgi:hypothetical protein